MIREPPTTTRTETTQTTNPSDQNTSPTTVPTDGKTDADVPTTPTTQTDADVPTTQTETTQTETGSSESNGNEDDGGYDQVNVDLEVSLIGPGHLGWVPQPTPGKTSSTASGRKRWSEKKKEEIARSLLTQRSLW